MHIQRRPEDFRIEELIEFPGERGAYAYYRVEKCGVPTSAVKELLAKQLKVTPSALAFVAQKPTVSVSIQYASVRKRSAETFTGEHFSARRVQWGPRALRAKDLHANRYTLMLRNLHPNQAQALPAIADDVARLGLPNYFDTRRFGSLSAEGFIGKAILTRDVEKLIRIYLSEPLRGDSREMRQFKRLVKSHWGQWGYLLHQAPRPSNLRSVIIHLKDHPHDYQKAANLIHDNLLSGYLAAYQAWIWNHILGRYLEQCGPVEHTIEIARERFPLITLPEGAREDLRAMTIEIPRLTARYEGPLETIAAAVLEAEGLTLRDFKTRILRRVYLTKGERATWFAPSELHLADPVTDTAYPGRQAVEMTFTLAPNHYATLIPKAMAARLHTRLRGRRA